MDKTENMEKTINVRETFKECMTCSRTYCHLINEHFNDEHDAIEKACDPLAGGIMNQGHQCGMLWGASLALGKKMAEAYAYPDEAIPKVVYLTERIMESFEETAGTTICNDIIEIDISKTSGLLKFIVKTTFQGNKKNRCFALAEDWYPEAIETIAIAMGDDIPEIKNAETCTSRLMFEMGGSPEDEIMVAGWGGGIGLSGHGCGALATAIWKVTKQWCDKHPGKNPPYFNNRPAKNLLKSFKELTGGTLVCKEICGRSFDGLEEHMEYIEKGGCDKLISLLRDFHPN